MVTIQDFILSQETLDKLNHSALIEEAIAQGKTMQDIFGFSNEALAEFYEAAVSILEQQRFQDATHAFTFLTTLNPHLADFWVGLGMAQRQCDRLEEAIYSFSMGYTIERESIKPYLLTAQCFMDMQDFDQALEVVESALTYAKSEPYDEKCQKLSQDAAAAKKFILTQRRI